MSKNISTNKENKFDVEKKDNQNNYDRLIAEQKRKDILREQEQIRKWIEEDEPLPIKMSCKLSQHLIPKEKNTDENH